MNMVRKEFERDDFTGEPHILIERKFEIFMNLNIFRNIISKVWIEEFSHEVLICLVCAGMVLTNIRIQRDFFISRDIDVGKAGGSNINIWAKQHRTPTCGRSTGKRQLGQLEKIRFVKTAEVE